MMTLPELNKFLPKGMPNPLLLRKGDKVFVRMARCSHLLQVGYVTCLKLAKEEVPALTLEVGQEDFAVHIELASGVDFVLTAGSDILYTPAWINLYAGTEVVEEPPRRGSGRLARLLENA